MFYERLHEALDLLVKFFHEDEKGLSYEVLHCQSFLNVEERLQYHKMDTTFLIDRFYRQRLQVNIKYNFSFFFSRNIFLIIPLTLLKFISGPIKYRILRVWRSNSESIFKSRFSMRRSYKCQRRDTARSKWLQ